jgi:two-component system, NtrC family, response regulator AtoC
MPVVLDRSISESPVQKVDFEPRFVAKSAPICRVQAAAKAVASRATTVMLLGETGSGKEMLARFVHLNSPRRDKPFIPVDCSALSESLFESQLFGHQKGSFTGAVRDTLGFIRAADGGTLFLDEIGELTLNLQAKLLRVLQERCVVPVGGTQANPVDVRVVCATNRDLGAMVEKGSFRQDLFFRINVVVLRVPPLRERTDDILALAEFFLARQAALAEEPRKTLHPEAAQSLMRYQWPGNIRELFNILEHAYVMCLGPVIQLADLPAPLCHQIPPIGRVQSPELNLERLERNAIVEALKRTHYNRAAACRLLGIEARRLNRRIEALQIAFPSSKSRGPQAIKMITMPAKTDGSDRISI